MPRSVFVPFSLQEVYGGFGEGEGVARADETGVTLEFELRDGVVGFLKSGVREVRVSLDEMSSVEVKTGPFGGQLTIATRTLGASSRVPGSKPGRVRLRVPRAGRQASREAAALLNTASADLEIEAFRRELDERRGGPNPPASSI